MHTHYALWEGNRVSGLDSEARPMQYKIMPRISHNPALEEYVDDD